MATYDFTQDSIKFKYEDGGISLPQKITTINNSRYPLLDALDIDWNNAYLTYLGKIKDDFFTEYKHTKFSTKKVPLVNAGGYHDTRYDEDADYKDLENKAEIEPNLPLWRSSYTINTTPQLLDLINYIVSRVVNADDKLLELSNLVNLTKLYLTFEESETNDFISFNPEKDTVKNILYTLKPCLGYETETKQDKDRSFTLLDVRTHPRAQANINLNVNPILMAPGNLSEYVLTTSVIPNVEGDINVDGQWQYDFTFFINGFNKNFKFAQYNVQFTSRRVEGKYDFIEPSSFLLDINKVENNFSSIIINDIEYIYIKEDNKNEETVKAFEAFGDKKPKSYFLIEKAFIKDDQYIDNADGTKTIKFEEPGNDVDNLNEKSIAWFLKNGKIVAKTLSGANIGYAPLFNSDVDVNIIKIYPTYVENIYDKDGKLTTQYSLGKDIYDINDVDVDSYIDFDLNSAKNINVSTGEHVDASLKWDEYKQQYYYEYRFKTKKIVQDDSIASIDLKLLITGTKYIAPNDLFYNVPIPCATTNAVNIIWTIDDSVLNEVNDDILRNKTNLLNEKDLVITYEILSQDVGNNGLNNIHKIALTVPLYSYKSFNNDNDINNFNAQIKTTQFNLSKEKDLHGDNQLKKQAGCAPFIKVFPEGFENSIDLTPQIKIDLDGTYKLYQSDETLKEQIQDTTIKNGNDLLNKFLYSNNDSFILSNKVPDNYAGVYAGALLSKYLQVKNITKDKNKNNLNNIFTLGNVNDANAEYDYFYLPIVLNIPGGSFSINDSENDGSIISYGDSKFYIYLRITRGSNKLVGFDKIYKTDANGLKSNEIISVKLLDTIVKNGSSDTNVVLYKSSNNAFDGNDNKISHYMTARNRAENIKNENITLDFLGFESFNSSCEIIELDEKLFAFTKYNVTEKDKIEKKYAIDSDTMLKINNMVLKHDDKWNALKYEFNNNFFFDFDISRLNRRNDIPAIEQNRQKFLELFGETKGNEYLNEIEANNITLNNYNIGSIDGITSAATQTDNSTSQDLIMFFGKNTNNVTLNLKHILNNLDKDVYNQNNMTINAMIWPNVEINEQIDINYWNVSFEQINQSYIDDFDKSPYKDFITVVNHVKNGDDDVSNISITFKNLQTLMNKIKDSSGQDIYEYPVVHNDVIGNVTSTMVNVSAIKVVIFVWIPYNEMFQGSLFQFKLKLVYDENFDTSKGGSKGYMGMFFIDANLIENELLSITPDSIPIYLTHFVDANGDGIISPEEINKWTGV